MASRVSTDRYFNKLVSVVSAAFLSLLFPRVSLFNERARETERAKTREIKRKRQRTIGEKRRS